MSVFNNYREAQKKGTIGNLLSEVTSIVQSQGALFDNAQVQRVVAMESLTDTDAGDFRRGMQSLEGTLASITTAHNQALGLSNGVALEALGPTARDAAIAAAIAGSDRAGFLGRDVMRAPAADQGYFIPAQGGLSKRPNVALEAFDERENRETLAISMTYNMEAATQDEFGETLFPTTVVAPDQYGLTISVRLTMVMDDLTRNLSADAIRNFKRLNVIRAMINPDVLRNDSTKIIPVVRAENVNKFVAAADVAVTNVIHEGQTIPTAPLAIGQTVDLMAVGTTDALLATGALGITDALDPMMALESIYVKLTTGGATPTTEVVKFSFINQMRSSTFNAAPQGNWRLQQLNFQTDALPVNSTTTQADGAASTILAPIVAAKAQVKLSLSVFGSANLQTAETSLMASNVAVASVFDSSNNQLDPTTGTGKTYADLFIGATIIGYDLEARRVNTNRRERGQILDLNEEKVIYGVPLLQPITAPRPPAGPQQDEANYLAALITTTRVRTSNAAVQKLIDAEQMLKNYVASNLGDDADIKPEILGVGGWFVQPQYIYRPFVASSVVDSLKSHERAADIQAALVNQVRDIAYRLYRDSGYKAASNALHGGVAPMPTCIVATDTLTAGYLQVVGDFRTLGNEFNVKVVSTTNKLMKNKILITFGVFGEGREGVPHPLHFGSMAWKSELTLILPTVRQGSNAREISVSPSFLHIVHLPVMGSIDVSGIEDVVDGKVEVFTSPTAARA